MFVPHTDSLNIASLIYEIKGERTNMTITFPFMAEALHLHRSHSAEWQNWQQRQIGKGRNVAAYFKILSQYLPWRTEGNYDNHQSG